MTRGHTSFAPAARTTIHDPKSSAPGLKTLVGWQWLAAQQVGQWRFAPSIAAAREKARSRALIVSARAGVAWSRQWVNKIEVLLAAKLVLDHGVQPTFLFHHQDSKQKTLQTSFGLDDIIVSHQWTNARERPDLKGWVASTTDRRDMAALTELTYRDVPVGRLGIASARLWVKKSRLETDEDWQAALRFTTEAAAEVDVGHRLIDELAPDLVVTNHATYSFFGGPMFHVALTRGLPTYTWQCRGPRQLTFRRFDDGADPLEHVTGITAAQWQACRDAPDAERRAAEADAWLQARAAGQHAVIPGAPRIGLKHQTDDAMDDVIDPSRPNVAVFTHLPWDAAGSFYQDLFPSLADHLEFTIRAARANQAVNWIFRLHPAEAHRGSAEDTEALLRAQLDGTEDNIRLVPSARPLSSYRLLGHLRAAVGIRGTLAIEAPCFGVRFVAAGTGQTTVAGVTRTCTTVEDYARALATIQDIEPPGEDERREALLLARAILIDNMIDLDCVRNVADLWSIIRLSPRRLRRDRGLTRIAGDMEQAIDLQGSPGAAALGHQAAVRA
jgi:hypothetical protein